MARDVDDVLYSEEDVQDDVADENDVELDSDVGTVEPDSASALLVTS